jgi:nucleoside-triphosphatase
MRTHLLLTGEIQIGKSTALRRFLARTGLAADGFMTYFESAERERDSEHDSEHDSGHDSERELKRDSERDLFIAMFDSLAPSAERRRAAHIAGTDVTVFGDAFDTYGADCLLRAGQRDIILMDELGRMEEIAPRFKEAVWRRLDGDIPVAGVIKLVKSPFLDAIRARPDVETITVTQENRDSIPELLASHFE